MNYQRDRAWWLANMTERHAEIDARGGGITMSGMEGERAHRDRRDLLREIREADAALAALGVTGEGTLAERIAALGAKPTPCDHSRFPLATDAGTYCTDCGEDVQAGGHGMTLAEAVMRYPEAVAKLPADIRAQVMPPPEPDIEPAVGDEP